MVSMKATDSVHISEVSPHTILPGQTFDVSEETAKDLEARGLAARVKDAGRVKNAGAAPKNKDAGAAPKNKAAKAPIARKGK